MHACILMVALAFAVEEAVPTELEALVPHASGVALVEVVELKDFSRGGFDGDNGVGVRLKILRSSGQVAEAISIVTEYTGLRQGQPPKPNGPVWPDSFKKGQRYWVAFASAHEVA